MILPDLNLLLYAYNPYVPQHDKARIWWQKALNDAEIIALPHEITLGFVRIATNPKLGAARVTLEEAQKVINSWYAQAQVRTLLPSENHSQLVLDLMAQCGARGQLISDASLAIYAMGNRATLCSNDSDFARFPGLQWHNPLSLN